MKKHSFFSVRTIATLFVGALVFLSSCQKEEFTEVLNAPISLRSSAPVVPDSLEVPAGFEVSFHTYASGVQVYVCTETSPGVFKWVFREPIAVLYSDPGFHGTVGTHYAGPTWRSNSGSAVVGTKIEDAFVDPTTIPWLLLGAVSSNGPGIFEGTTYIQRINTTGGKAPSTADASSAGQELHVPYTAEYYFYQPE